uniref:Thyroglobulin type-1 domain-containing protein n=1 Tax=Hippocampus comes TaxID=109280 RepID=A0A3Q2YKC0_HIPCM
MTMLMLSILSIVFFFLTDQRPKTHCEHHRASVQTTSPEGYPLVGAFVPQCDAHGQYTPQQCHGSIGQCWCVDSNGQERAGTRTPSGVPPVDCDAPGKLRPLFNHAFHVLLDVLLFALMTSLTLSPSEARAHARTHTHIHTHVG